MVKIHFWKEKKCYSVTIIFSSPTMKLINLAACKENRARNRIEIKLQALSGNACLLPNLWDRATGCMGGNGAALLLSKVIVAKRVKAPFIFILPFTFRAFRLFATTLDFCVLFLSQHFAQRAQLNLFDLTSK